jgi:hypothetical protein
MLTFLFCGCGEEEPCQNISLSEIFPNENASGEPVLLRGEGFTDRTEIRFGNVVATALESDNNYISTRVPQGLNGLVEVSLKNGDDCFTAMDFEVLNQPPGGLPAGPAVYVIPTAGSTFVPRIPQEQEIRLANVFDNTHTLLLSLSVITDDVYDVSFGEENLEGEFYQVSGTVNLSSNETVLEIDRSEDPPDDRLEGGFYSFDQPIGGKSDVFLAFSTITGRQYVFYQTN